MSGRLNDTEVAAEMTKMADEEFNIEKAKLVRQETIAIEAFYQKKLKQAEVARKMSAQPYHFSNYSRAHSNHVNKNRLRLLQARQQVLDELFEDAKSKLTAISSDPVAYQTLLKDLLLQAFHQLMEDDVVIQCRKEDVSLVQKAAEEAKAKYGAKLKFAIDSGSFLPEKSGGGVIVSANGGRIRVSNTLESRLEILGDVLSFGGRMRQASPPPLMEEGPDRMPLEYTSRIGSTMAVRGGGSPGSVRNSSVNRPLPGGSHSTSERPEPLLPRNNGQVNSTNSAVSGQVNSNTGSPVSSAGAHGRKKSTISGLSGSSAQQRNMERKAARTALLLSQRLYTFSARPDGPRFTVGAGRRGDQVLAVVTQQGVLTPAGPSRLDPFGDIDLSTVPAAAEPLEVRFKPRLLKAKKALITPSSSQTKRPRISSIFPHASNDLDDKALWAILRPPKRVLVDEETCEDQAHETTSLFQTPQLHSHPVVPPIPSYPQLLAGGYGRAASSNIRTGRGSGRHPDHYEATNTDTVKRVRMMDASLKKGNEHYADNGKPDCDNDTVGGHLSTTHQYGIAPGFRRSKERIIKSNAEALLDTDTEPKNGAFMTGEDDLLNSGFERSKDPFAFIEYLQQRPSSKEFAYMNIVKPTAKQGNLTFNPYNLEIVDFSKVDKRYGYYTISNALCEETLSHKTFLNIHEQKCYHLDEFSKQQKEWVEEDCRQFLREFRSRLEEIVEAAGKNCMKEKGFDVTLKEPGSDEDIGSGNGNFRSVEKYHDELLKAGKRKSDNVSNGQGILSIPMSQKLTFTEQAARRSECRRLQRFVKLVDYILINTLHMLTIESLRELLRAVFRGCTDSDVLVPLSHDRTGTLAAARENAVDNVSAEIGDTSAQNFPQDKERACMDYLERAGLDMELLQNLQVGGVTVGPEVGTSELIACGFDGFSVILSRITRAAITPFPVVELMEEEALGSDMAIEESEDSVNRTLHGNHVITDATSTKLDLATDLKRKQSTFLPLFRVELLLNSDSEYKNLYLSPSLSDYLMAIDVLIRSFIAIVDEVKPLTNTIPYLDPANLAGGAYSSVRGLEDNDYANGPQVTEIIMDGGYFREVCGRIRGALVGIFGNASKWMQTWEEVRCMWVENEGFDCIQALEQAAGKVAVVLATSDPQITATEGGVAAMLMASLAPKPLGSTDALAVKSEDRWSILEMASTIASGPDGNSYSPLVEFFEHSLNTYSSQKQIMNQIPLSSVINNLRVDIATLKGILIPSPERCFTDVSDILPGIARDKNELLLGEVQAWVRILNTQPANVEGFVEYLGWLDRGPTLRQLKEAVDMASDTKEENIARFSGELDKSVADLMQEVAEIRNRAQDPMVLNPGAKCEIVIKFLEDLRSQLDKIDALKSKYEQWGELFKIGGGTTTGGKQEPKYVQNKSNDLDETRLEVDLKRTLWVSLKDWETLTESWKSQPFDLLSTDEVNSQITLYLKTVYTLDKGLPPNEVVPKLKAMVDEYRGMYSTIVDLRNPTLKQRHWEKIQDALGKTLVKDETFTLGKLIELRVFDFKEEIGNISSQAGSEAALEEMLSKVVKTWNEAEFLVIGYRESKDVFILGSIDDIQALLEDSQVTIATIKGSRFIGPIKSEIDRWDKQLSLFADTLDAWLTCQRNWLYLESIFSAPDIQRQLPDEARMFSQNNALLDQIQKCLEDYLESKRLLFPRFYFLSNEELLEILSQTRNPHAVQPHLSKCFDAIKSLEFSSADPKSIDIVAMISPEGERVPFSKTLKARGNVEGWLGLVEEAMVAVLRRLLKSALAEFDDRNRSDWLRDHVGQVVVAGNQIIFCRDVSEAIKSIDPNRALNALRQKCINNLAGTASLVRGELTKTQRSILGAIITIDVHNRDIVQNLITAKVTGLADFEWTKQLRYYWDMDSDTCNVKMSSTVFSYGYEYLGCSPRLVITPLTDRCYLTLTGAMQLNLGGSPVGPAGTGKTETVKDLAKAMARQCVVFNCSDGLDYKMMGKMFAGLAQSGAWCCFDEFNRIDIEVLSDMRATKFNFEGREIRLIETCAAFITMNPGYAGRTELPDNLKALFRPIAMMIPDYGLIAEIMLFSEGFENAKVLAGKVVNLYKLCSEQLSQQDHYDFGMRAVKSVLVMAGSLKRANPDLSEDVVLIRSLRDSNLPKFLAEDVGLFKGILQDLFPGVNVPEKDFFLLTNAIAEAMKERNLEVVPSFVTRICQLYETMKIRHGVMLVGPTGGGKTTCYEVLKDASNKIKERNPGTLDFQKVKTWVLNPKCVAMTELYGEFNLATMEWKDGLIGSIFRAQVADTSNDEKWTVCDGPVDALWIENMNTVLDDNKLLTLINGERIKMSPSMHMLFEVADLAVASPATTSSAQTQQIIELKLEKKRKNILGPPSGSTKVVLFIDDLNMPKLDSYGSQPPIELLRQYLDFGGFYDREKLYWKVIQDRGVPPEERAYVEFTDMRTLGSLLEEYLEEYNVTLNKELRLIFFLDAQQHITRISRIIRQPRGNALLIKTETFLEDINNILNSGEVPSLFEFDEREKILGGSDMRDRISEMCVEIHTSVTHIAKKFYAELRRRYYTTPTSYLELINLYITMLQEKRKELGAARDRLRNGLNKLAETNELVAAMQIELEQLGPELKNKAADVESLMIKIAKDQEMADGVRKVVSEEEAVVREQAKSTEAIAAEAQKDLDEALPALQAAYKSLETLDKKDIAELKVFTKPPDLVLMVMEAVCILFKVKPDWDNSKKLLSDPQFMRKMTEYDKDNIPESITKKLKKYVENPSFNADSVEKVSKACKSMVMWVIAMDIYSRVFKEVQPKKKRLEEAQATLELTRSKLAEKTAALQEVENQLDKLKQKYETSIASKKTLAEKMEETTRRLSRASQLTLALADEQVRWMESIETLNMKIDALVGNIFLCAASVAYFGAFTSVYRQELVRYWIRKCQDIGIPVSETFNLSDNLADPAIVRDWNIQGLPSDALSTENGILVTRGRRWPLMIDPQGQANKWIRNMEGSELRVVKLSEAKFLRSIENAVRTGAPVLLEDVGEHLDPALEPLLLKQTIRQGGRVLMKLGDSLVEYDRNFKLYITTKLSNPHYLPEVCIKVTIINFTVTKVGLEGQLLADVVKLEKPELEEQRNTLIVNIANDKRQLKDIEEKILKLLFNSEGNILDDEELIQTLNQSKITSAAIKERVSQSEATEKEINNVRERYRPVAIRGSVLYFVIADLAEIDPMYQFSLNYFKNQFNQCIVDSEKADDLERRIEILCANATFSLFANVSRGLFEAHKLIFSFMICVAIMRQAKQIDEVEWNYFLRGSGKMTSDIPPKPAAAWLTPIMWQNCVDLSRYHGNFKYLAEHLTAHVTDWDDFIETENPYNGTVPGGFIAKPTDFQKLILVKIFREETLVAAVLDFVRKNLGQSFIDIPPLDLAKVYKDTTNKSPLIFILSTGSDPISALQKFAASKDINMLDRLHMISLGQGQGPIAEDLLRRATAKGDWLFLQNCHLAASWMNRLETLVKELSSENEPHSNFRLFLSSMPSKVFPTAVLQDGVKVTNEPPKGLRANLARSFADISRDLFDDAPPQGYKFKKLIFGICFFNAIIHERKKFGPLGWNISYDWSNSDLEVSISILKNVLKEGKNIPWDALIYLTGEITFGGRVTDDWDRRTLKSLLSRYYTPLILEDSYKLSPSGIYYAPPDGDLASFRTYIDTLPFAEDPSVFGMHENANVSYQMQESRRLVKTVLDVQPRMVSGSGTVSSEEIVVGIASTILDAWPEPIVIDLTGETNTLGVNALGKPDSNRQILELTFKKDESGRMLNSLSTVLMQETVRFNKLLNLIKKSLENLIKAVKGIIVMSSDLELVFKSLLNNEVW
ncbi:Dynein heavy chain 6, axonemal [Phlyctochytrium bullatum]|nr:Dynein heavy chain 6, axonemal [Phlyctochytrium bullatum]